MGKNAKVQSARGRTLASSIAVLLLASAPVVQSQESTWIGNESGNWSVPANWLGSAVPVGGPGSALRFDVAATGAITATNDLAAPLSVNRLHLENRTAGMLTIAGGALTFTGIAPEIAQESRGNVTLSTPLILDGAGAGTVRITGSGLGALTITGPISEKDGSASLVIGAQPLTSDTQIITLTGENTTTGGITLESGNLSLGANAVGAGNAPLVVKGGSLRVHTGGFANPIILHSDLQLMGRMVMSGQISSAVEGTGLIVRANSPQAAVLPQPDVSILQPSTYTGATRVDYLQTSPVFGALAGAMSVTGSGALSGTSQIDLSAGAALLIGGNLEGALQDRINDAAAISLRSGRLILQTSWRAVPPGPSTPQIEKLGDVNVGGYSTITIDRSTSLGTDGELVLASLQRVDHGTLLLRGIAGQGSRGRVTLSALPIDLVGSGNGVTTPIVPYAIGDPSPTADSATAGLVTYDPGVGFRSLENSEYANDLETPGSNVRLAEATINNVERTINALVLTEGGLSGSGALNIETGLILNQVSNSNARIDQRLNFGSSDGKIFTRGHLSIDGEISGDGGLTKAGEANLYLNGANTFTGPITINSGAIGFSAPQALGQGGNDIVFNGPNVELIFNGSGDHSLSNDIVISSGKARLVNQASLALLEYIGSISGSGSLFISTGIRGGVMRLTGNNTFTGPVVIEEGELQIHSDAALGSGNDLTIRAGELSLLGNWTTDRTIRLDGVLQSTIDTNGFLAKVDGPVLGGGWLQKAGEGTLAFSSPHLLLERLSINEGTLSLAGAALTTARDISVSLGAVLLSDQTAAESGGHLTSAAKVTLLGGRMVIAGREGVQVSEQVESLSLQGSKLSSLELLSDGSAGSGTALSAGSLAINGRGLLVQAEHLGTSANRFVLSEPASLQSGVAIGVFSRSGPSGSEMLTTYDQASDQIGRIGFRPLATLVAQEIRTEANGGAIPETANLFLSEGGTVAHGAVNKINSLTIGPGGSLFLAPGQTVSVESGAVLAQSAAGAARIVGGTLELGSESATFAMFREMEVTSALAGAASLRILGDARLTLDGSVDIEGGITVMGGTLRMTGENSYSGPTVLRGNLVINSDAALGASPSLTFESSGSSLRLDGPWRTSRRVVLSASSDLFLDGNNAVLESALEGTGDLRLHGPGELLLLAASSYSGTVRLNGDVRLAEDGSILSRSVVATAGMLTLDNRAKAVSNRLRDDVNLNRPGLTLIGNAAVGVVEAVGVLNVPTLGVTPGVRIMSAGNQPTILSADSIIGGIGLKTIAGDDLGGSGAGFTRLLSRRQPVLQGGLLPNTLASESADGLPQSFAVYDSGQDEHGAIGVRAIMEGEYSTSPLISNAGGSANFLAASAVLLGTGEEAINSLTMRGEGAISMTPEQTLTIANGAVLVQSDASAALAGGRMDLGSTARFIVNSALDMDSALTASRLEKYGPGTMHLGDVSLADTMSVAEGTLVLEGSVSNNGGPLGAPITIANEATLAGSGAIEGRLIVSGTLAPGDDGVGLIRTQDLTLQPASVLSLELDSPTAFDRLEIAEALYLPGSVTLNLALAFDPVDFVDSFTVISNAGSAPISLSSGHFTFGGMELREGSRFLAGEQYFEISYAGGAGNDVVLRAVPEPTVSLLALCGFAAYPRRWRTSRRSTQHAA